MQQQLQGDEPANEKQEAIFDPQHSRPLSTTIWTEDPALVSLVQEIWNQHFATGEAEKQKGGKKPRRPYIEQLRVLVLVLTRFGTRLRTASAPGCMTFGASSSKSAGLRASEGEKRGDLNYRSGSRLRWYCQ